MIQPTGWPRSPVQAWRLVIDHHEVDCFANPISAAVAATNHYGEALWWETHSDGRQWLAWSHRE